MSQDQAYLNTLQSLGFRPDIVEPEKFVAGPLRFGIPGALASQIDLASATGNTRDQALSLAFGAGANPLCKVQIEAMRITIVDNDLTDQNILDMWSQGYVEHSAGNSRNRHTFSPAWVGVGFDTMYPPLAAGAQPERNGYRAGVMKLPIPWIVDFSADQLTVNLDAARPCIVEIFGAAWPRDISPAWEDELPVGVIRALTVAPGYPIPR